MQPHLAAEVRKQAPATLAEGIRLARSAEYASKSTRPSQPTFFSSTPARSSSSPAFPRGIPQSRSPGAGVIPRRGVPSGPPRTPGTSQPLARDSRPLRPPGAAPVVICYNCGRPGHVAKHCRAPGGGAYSGPSGSSAGGQGGTAAALRGLQAQLANLQAAMQPPSNKPPRPPSQPLN